MPRCPEAEYMKLERWLDEKVKQREAKKAVPARSDIEDEDE